MKNLILRRIYIKKLIHRVSIAFGAHTMFNLSKNFSTSRPCRQISWCVLTVQMNCHCKIDQLTVL